MDFIRSVKTLETLYGKASPASLRKVADHLTPLYQAWIGAGRRYDGAGKWPCILDGGSGPLPIFFRR